MFHKEKAGAHRVALSQGTGSRLTGWPRPALPVTRRCSPGTGLAPSNRRAGSSKFGSSLLQQPSRRTRPRAGVRSPSQTCSLVGELRLERPGRSWTRRDLRRPPAPRIGGSWPRPVRGARACGIPPLQLFSRSRPGTSSVVLRPSGQWAWLGPVQASFTFQMLEGSVQLRSPGLRPETSLSCAFPGGASGAAALPSASPCGDRVRGWLRTSPHSRCWNPH